MRVILIAVLFLIACGDEPSKLECPAGKTCGFTSVAAGYEHTCAIFAVVEGAADDYGQVVCWGENRDGRCGAASGFGESQAQAPVVVADLKDAKSIVAGGTQSCALRATGKVVCWGGNAFGELGNDEPEGSFTPIEPKFPPVARDIVQLAAGGSSLGGTTCARDTEGKVWCWGRNDQQQVRPGNGDTQKLPIQIQNITAASDVSVGQDFGCAINGGDVQCWGNGFASAPSTILTAEAIDGPLLSSKGFVTCVRGANDIQCFSRINPYPRTPDLVSTPIRGASQVATGARHTCALRDNGNAVCWGTPRSALGIGANDTGGADLSNELSLLDVDLVNGNGDPLVVQQIASGASHSCALEANDHQIYCWGDNTQGQLGDGTETSRPVPTLVQLQP